MLYKNLKPNVVTCNALLYGFCIEGSMLEAIEIHVEMVQNNFPYVITYNGLVHGFYMAGQTQEVTNLLDEIIGKGVEPYHITYTTSIWGHCKHGKLQKEIQVM